VHDSADQGFARAAGLAGLVFVAVLSLALAPGARTAAAQAYEPNESLATATGPLLFGQAYSASLETQADRDFFFFYVGSTDPVQTVLTVENLGGGPSAISEIDATILDPLGAYAGGDFVYLGGGDRKTSTVALEPGKYFLEVLSREGFGDTYRVTTGGETGAFAAYGEIAARCTRATATARLRRNRLEKAKNELQRAVNRVQRSRYGSPRSRRAARTLRSKAGARVAARKRALKDAVRRQQPWCSIPQ
jgi:hypothetical protein